jgi:hypothetical protein
MNMLQYVRRQGPRVLLLVVIVLIGAYFRLNGLYSWDEPSFRLHPDERFLTEVASQIDLPNSFHQFIDSSTTPLQRREDGLFAVAGAPKGQDITPGPITPGLTSGALEGSNVNALDVMIKLMDQSRSFEQQINMIKEAKANDESGETMMKAS